ncbi:hypothetical protein BGZ94_004107 [Podila epigama]|nr:hypothetical protein BGZ94_004107 [Podila epigama]
MFPALPTLHGVLSSETSNVVTAAATRLSPESLTLDPSDLGPELIFEQDDEAFFQNSFYRSLASLSSRTTKGQQIQATQHVSLMNLDPAAATAAGATGVCSANVIGAERIYATASPFEIFNVTVDDTLSLDSIAPSQESTANTNISSQSSQNDADSYTDLDFSETSTLTDVSDFGSDEEDEEEAERRDIPSTANNNDNNNDNTTANNNSNINKNNRDKEKNNNKSSKNKRLASFSSTTTTTSHSKRVKCEVGAHCADEKISKPKTPRAQKTPVLRIPKVYPARKPRPKNVSTGSEPRDDAQREPLAFEKPVSTDAIPKTKAVAGAMVAGNGVGKGALKEIAVHPDGGYVCSQCPGERFGRVHDLKRHQESKHWEMTWPCDFCHRPFVRRDALLRHYAVKSARRDGLHPTEQETDRLYEAKARAKARM